MVVDEGGQWLVAAAAASSHHTEEVQGPRLASSSLALVNSSHRRWCAGGKMQRRRSYAPHAVFSSDVSLHCEPMRATADLHVEIKRTQRWNGNAAIVAGRGRYRV